MSAAATTSKGPGKSPAPKRDASYYREYRRRKKAEREAEKMAVRIGRSGGPITQDDMREALDWIEATLIVPSGPLAGTRFKIPPFQSDWLMAACAPDVREAGMSIARKNGKSGVIAAVFLAVLCGPLNRPDFRIVVTSLTGNLAKELRDAMEHTAIASGMGNVISLTKNPPPGRIEGIDGAVVQFLAADRASGHAIGADLAVVDEAGLLRENQRSLWNALFSAVSGRNGRLWGISIQGDGPMFAEMEARDGSPRVHWKKFAAPSDCALDDPAAWEAANPGLESGIKSTEYMRDAAERAIEAPSNEMHFRAYDLNQPVDPDRHVIVTVNDYVQCIDAEAPRVGGDLVIGIDLGHTLSMTCAVAVSLDTGAILCRGAFGDDPPISRRSEIDRMGALYDRMMREGELRLYAGRVTPVVPFLEDFFAEIADMGRVVRIGLDRQRRAEAEMAFREARVPGFAVEWRGQGASTTADGSHDVRAFQRFVIEKRLKTRGSTMLESAIASSVLRFDRAGNPALDKASKNSRIDCLSAAVIACGIAELVPEAPLLKVSVV